ncbi:MAG: hypothetical protein PHO04_01760 [Candidatus Pacebacteria bacterium]|nr:hypothetical protein [Candidatus Paceibacterota bacterium]MDD2796701.1 hypothetical protein [Candidatus Paceibacterota bacterium]MDD3048185.1 hypothetical protein [Candidatus Paceibacterota bacterium]MDD3510136.1 hypothetical protein [Candidatus Paceibacterota bacterium]MDD3918781.1 hypothetical protein [Candidatus Paceibacterota bacterium]
MENKEKTPEQETTNREQISSFLEKKSRILDLESKVDNPATADTLKRKIEDLDIEFPNPKETFAKEDLEATLAEKEKFLNEIIKEGQDAEKDTNIRDRLQNKRILQKALDELENLEKIKAELFETETKEEEPAEPEKEELVDIPETISPEEEVKALKSFLNESTPGSPLYEEAKQRLDELEGNTETSEEKEIEALEGFLKDSTPGSPFYTEAQKRLAELKGETKTPVETPTEPPVKEPKPETPESILKQVIDESNQELVKVTEEFNQRIGELRKSLDQRLDELEKQAKGNAELLARIESLRAEPKPVDQEINKAVASAEATLNKESNNQDKEAQELDESRKELYEKLKKVGKAVITVSLALGVGTLVPYASMAALGGGFLGAGAGASIPILEALGIASKSTLIGGPFAGALYGMAMTKLADLGFKKLEGGNRVKEKKEKSVEINKLELINSLAQAFYNKNTDTAHLALKFKNTMDAGAMQQAFLERLFNRAINVMDKETLEELNKLAKENNQEKIVELLEDKIPEFNAMVGKAQDDTKSGGNEAPA